MHKKKIMGCTISRERC